MTDSGMFDSLKSAGWAANGAECPPVWCSHLLSHRPRGRSRRSSIFRAPIPWTRGRAILEIDLPPQAPGTGRGGRTTIYSPSHHRFADECGGRLQLPVFHNGDQNPSSLGYFQPDLKVKFYNDDVWFVASTGGFVANRAFRMADSRFSQLS